MKMQTKNGHRKTACYTINKAGFFLRTFPGCPRTIKHQLNMEVIMDKLVLCILSMLIAGAFGGFVFGINQKDDKNLFSVLTHTITGILGGFIIPLLLQLISSDILSWVTLPDFEIQKYLIFVAFCGLGGFSSNSLLPAISNKLLNQLQEVKNEATTANRKVDEIQQLISEPEENENELQKKMDNGNISEDEEKIIKALSSSKYYLRSISGIKKDTNLDNEILTDKLNEMQKKKIIGSKTGELNNKLYFIEPKN